MKGQTPFFTLGVGERLLNPNPGPSKSTQEYKKKEQIKQLHDSHIR